jgi:pyruvate formate lyase activating enzyme
VRTPLIPGCTFTRQNIDEIGAFLSAVSNGNLERWELCAFNNLCRDKYRRLGMDWSFNSTPLLAQEQIEDAGAWAKSSGFDPGRIFVTGASRVEIR